MARPAFFLFLIFLLAGCKEINDEFPLQPWDVFFYKTEKISPRTISAIYYDSDHNWWLGSKGNEGVIYNDGYKMVENPGGEKQPAFGHINDIKTDGLGQIWVAWRGGLASYSSGTWSEIEAFKGMDVSSVAIKGIAEVWISVRKASLPGGIAYYNGHQWNWLDKDANGLPGEEINGIIFDHNQVLWIASSKFGLIKYQNHAFQSINFSNSDDETDNVACLCVAENKIWAGTIGGEILGFVNGELERLSTGTGKPVSALAAGSGGILWIATLGSGVITYHHGEWKLFNRAANRLPSDTLYALAGTPEGKILAACEGGKIIRFSNR